MLLEALEVARTVTEDYQRVEALIALVPRLPAAERDDTVRETLTVARTMTWDAKRAEALVELVPYLLAAERDAVLQEALEAARSREKPE